MDTKPAPTSRRSIDEPFDEFQELALRLFHAACKVKPGFVRLWLPYVGRRDYCKRSALIGVLLGFLLAVLAQTAWVLSVGKGPF